MMMQLPTSRIAVGADPATAEAHMCFLFEGIRMQGRPKLNIQQEPLLYTTIDPALSTLALTSSPKRGYKHNVVQLATGKHAIADQTSSATVSPRRTMRP